MYRTQLLAPVLLMIVLGAGCGIDPGAPPKTGSTQARLTVSPMTMNFGSVALGSSESQTGTLTASSSDVTVSSAAWNGQGFSVSGMTFPSVVRAGHSVSFTVTFMPQSVGISSGTISFHSDAANSPTSAALSATGSLVQHTVHLSWAPSTSAVVGYNIYRGTNSGGPYAKLNSALLLGTTFADSNVQSGEVYFYVATSVDANHVESSPSNETEAEIPLS